MALTPITVSTHNVFFGLSPAKIKADIAKAREKGTTVIAFQEMGQSSDRAVLRQIPNWAAYDTGKARNNPIAWDKRVWKKVASWAHHLSDAGPVNDGAGGTHIAAKYAAVVRLEHIKTGRKITFISVHYAATSNGGGVPHNTARGDKLREQVRKTRNLVRDRQKLGEIVILMGDFNINYREDAERKHPEMPYRMIGMEEGCWPTWRTINTPAGGTHRKGNRVIDWICCSTDKTRIVPRSHKIVPIHSDHDTVIATFGLVTAKSTETPVPLPPATPVPADPDAPYDPASPWGSDPVWADVTFPEQCV